MNQIWWWMVEPVSRLLEHDERETVLGDLEESHQTGPRALLDVLDVVIRRQAHLWMGWHPWLIFLGLFSQSACCSRSSLGRHPMGAPFTYGCTPTTGMRP